METRQRILEAARDLFAQHGVAGVSVRDIAATAGVTHPLVHRYFGTKGQMVAEILRRESEEVAAGTRDSASQADDTSAEMLRVTTDYALKESRTAFLLLMRAEMDGLGPDDSTARGLSPLLLLVELLSRQQPSADPARLRMLVAMYGAALFGFNAVGEWLAREVGLEGDTETVREEFAELLTKTVTTMAGALPEVESGDDRMPDARAAVVEGGEAKA